MLTLRSYVETLTDSGPYVVKEIDGSVWTPDELVEWLEWQAPVPLEQTVWFSSLDGDGSGMLYILNAQGTVIGSDPRYRIERRYQPSRVPLAPPPGDDRTDRPT